MVYIINGSPLDVAAIKAQLMEDFKVDKIRKSIDQIELLAEIYGTGIGEIVVKTEKVFVPATQAIPVNESVARDCELFCQVLSVRNNTSQVIQRTPALYIVCLNNLIHLALRDAKP